MSRIYFIQHETSTFVFIYGVLCVQYTDQEMIPVRNARNVVTLAEVMFVTIQRENILLSKITD
jgi:hypothetical protein